MNKKYYLALDDFIDQDNKGQVRNIVLRLFGVEIGLQICYLLFPLYLKIVINNSLVKLVLMIAFIACFSIIAQYFNLTAKVLNERGRFSKRYAEIIYCVVVSILIIIPGLVDKVILIKVPVSRVVNIFLSAVFAAVCEEYLFRGILLNIFLLVFRKYKYIFVWSTIATSIIFGLIHAINIIHQPLMSTLGQIIFAFTMGLILGYLRLVSNGIVWCIVLHFWQDFTPQISSSNLGNSHIKVILLISLPAILLLILCIYEFNHQYLNNLIKLKI